MDENTLLPRDEDANWVMDLDITLHRCAPPHDDGVEIKIKQF
jgi:hypothetical protein